MTYHGFRDNINFQKVEFSKIGDVISIEVKNNFDVGLDSNCFKIINFIFSILGPTKTKFNLSTLTHTNTGKVSKVNISFHEKDYKYLMGVLYGE